MEIHDFWQENGNFLHANADFLQENGKFPHASGDFLQENSEFLHANGDFLQENAEFLHANSDFLRENAGFLHADGDFRQENGVCPPDGWQFIDRNWPVGLSRQRLAQYRAQSLDAFADIIHAGAAEADAHLVVGLLARRIVGVTQLAGNVEHVGFQRGLKHF